MKGIEHNEIIPYILKHFIILGVSIAVRMMQLNRLWYNTQITVQHSFIHGIIDIYRWFVHSLKTSPTVESCVGGSFHSSWASGDLWGQVNFIALFTMSACILDKCIIWISRVKFRGEGDREPDTSPSQSGSCYSSLFSFLFFWLDIMSDMCIHMLCHHCSGMLLTGCVHCRMSIMVINEDSQSNGLYWWRSTLRPPPWTPTTGIRKHEEKHRAANLTNIRILLIYNVWVPGLTKFLCIFVNKPFMYHFVHVTPW